MKYINRSVAIIRPKQPYIDWANSFNDDGPTLELEEARAEANAYLIKEHDEIKQSYKFVERNYARIFEEELNGWMQDPELWPQKRNFKIFKKWFDVESSEMVFDLGKDTIEVEEF